MKKFFTFLMVVVCAFVLVACGKSEAPKADGASKKEKTAQADSKGQKANEDKAAANGELVIKMLNIGQGDAILISHGKKKILVDAGDVDDPDKKMFIERLKEEKIEHLDCVILTHPHADHIGGIDYVLNNIKVDIVYDNGQTATTKLYKNYLTALKTKKIKSKTLTDGDVLDFGDGLRFVVVSPTKAMRQDGGRDKNGKINLNLNSIMGRLEYGEFTMMFTGDGEASTEAGILQRHKAAELKSHVLKSGHHGSKTSSSDAFLKAVQPDVAIISCGVGNDYHHPHPSIRTKYAKAKIDFYRTDVNGTITIKTTGKKDGGKLYSLKTQKGKKNDETNN